MTNRLDQNYIHLGLGATAMLQPPFTGMAWYEDYGSRTTSDGAEGRLVSLSTFTQSWDSWEMHPDGDEVVICTAGHMTLHQQFADGTTTSVTISANDRSGKARWNGAHAPYSSASFEMPRRDSSFSERMSLKMLSRSSASRSEILLINESRPKKTAATGRSPSPSPSMPVPSVLSLGPMPP